MTVYVRQCVYVYALMNDIPSKVFIFVPYAANDRLQPPLDPFLDKQLEDMQQCIIYYKS